MEKLNLQVVLTIIIVLGLLYNYPEIKKGTVDAWTQASEEAVVETTVDSTAIYEDAAYSDTTVTVEGEEASAE
jgi:hypothetical protein